jgi:DNA segregation ATPase FtsK/SpoIIIE, S-DNA-T family
MSRKTTVRERAGKGAVSRRGATVTTRAPARTTGGAGGRDQVRDAWGVGLLFVAVMAGLGLYGHAAGAAGQYLELLFRGLFGVFGLLVPPALGAAGVALLRAPSPGHRRVAVGAALAFVALAGLWHLVAGAPDFGAPLSRLHASAGWLGALVARPLVNFAAGWGSGLLLTALLGLGLLVATATTPRQVATGAGGAARAAWAWAGRRRPRPDGGGAVTPQPAPTRRGPGDDDRDGASPADDDDTAPLPAPGPPPPRAPSTARRRSPGARPDYQPPPLSLLRAGRSAAGNKRALDRMTRALEGTLGQFDVDARVVRIARGPTVTRFEIQLGAGVKVAAVTRLGEDISYALATADIRIVAPIPGKSAIGIEVPNRDRDLVTLGDVLRSPEAAAQSHPLVAGVGVDIAGNPVLVNLATMPHLLIAGATGSGKSVTMNGIVTSMLMRNPPRRVRMILIDPKRVELNHYDGAPHLLTRVVTDPKRATEALVWTVKEMERRYERLALLGYRNLDTYNQAVREGAVRTPSKLTGGEPRGGEGPAWEELPYVLVVIDELADLMMVAPRDVESAIVRIAQMARAVGLHLIVATQRPSVDVVTGLIKANIPSRLALAMATQADSRTILDQGGAEKLVGNGDMLFMSANMSRPHRIQGCYVDGSEVEQVVRWVSGQRAPDYAPGVVRSGKEATLADAAGEDATDADLVTAAMELVVRSGLGSTSMLQRKLKVGFARAGRIMDELETRGVVGPSEGSKARTVLMTVEELEERLESDA